MWKYIAAALLFLIGAIEIVLAVNGRLREEIMKNSPIQSTRAAPFYLFSQAYPRSLWLWEFFFTVASFDVASVILLQLPELPRN